MPHWDFQCPVCKITNEISFPSFEASKNATCPDCKVPLIRLVSKPGTIIFKGSGFYKTDYK